MKIAIIGSFRTSLPLADGVIHAPLALSYDLARKLSEYGHDVTYFGSFDDVFAKKHFFKFDDLDYIKISENSDQLSLNDVKLIQYLLAYEQSYVAKVLEKQEDYDVFYTWSINRVGPFARLINKPVVFTHHDSTSFKEHKSLLEALDCNNAYLLPISKYVASNLSSKNTLEVVYNGVDVGEYSQVGSPSDYLLWVGRVVPPKGLDLALDLAKDMGYKLRIAGKSGSFNDFPNLEKYNELIFARINEMSNVEFLGPIPHESVLKQMSRASGLIFPTDGTEACPMVAIEAIRCGTPVITSAKGPMPEIIEQGITGFLCETMEDYKHAIESLPDFDRSKCAAHAEKRFSLDAMAKGYEEAFLNLV